MGDDSKFYFTDMPCKFTELVGRKIVCEMDNGTEIHELTYAATNGKQYKIIAKYDVDRDKLTPIVSRFET